MVEFIKYVFLGLVQGITELLPVSSSGHVTFYSHVMGINPNQLTHFLIITNFGSFIAMFIHYRKDVLELTKSFFLFCFSHSKRQEEQQKNDMAYIIKLIIAVIPIALVGLFFRDLIPQTLLSVGIAFIITAVILFVLYLRRNHFVTQELSYQKSLYYGLIHMIAIVPGISRSGTGYFSGLIQGVEIKKTIRFTFLIYLIISIPVTILGVYDLFQSNEPIHLLYALVALLTSFIGTFLLVNIIHKVITFKSFKYFAFYAFFMGVMSLLIYFL